MMETDTCTCTHTLHVKIKARQREAIKKANFIALSGHFQYTYMYTCTTNVQYVYMIQGKTKGSS